MANFGQFSTFLIFSHKKWFRLTRNCQFHYQNMAHYSEPVEMSQKSAMLQSNWWKLKYLSEISTNLHKTFIPGLVFPSRSNDQNWWKLKYLSGISTDLHKTFITGLIFVSRSKWVQGVLCYYWNWQKLKYLSKISTNLHETFITGLIFPSRSK